MSRRRLKPRRLLPLATAAVVACETSTGAPLPWRIEISPSEPTVLAEDTIHLVAMVVDRAERPLEGVPISWSSSDTSVAAVDSAGVVWTRRAGVARIRAASGEASASADIAVRAPDPVVWKQAMAAYTLTCALSQSGEAHCWQLGEAAWLTTSTRFTSLSAGSSAMCGLSTEATGHCLASGIRATFDPLPVPGGSTFQEISGGLSGCGITTQGITRCWTASVTAAGEWRGPHALSGDPGLASLSDSQVFGTACGLTSRGVAYCWGTNQYGQLGNGTREASGAAARVATDLRFSAIDVGFGHVCALTTEGEAYCWGSNNGYQLGLSREAREGCNLTDAPEYPRLFNHSCAIPQRVPTELRFSAIRPGQYRTCALTRDGKAYCWGANFGKGLGVATLAAAGVETREWCRLGGGYECTPTPVAVSGRMAFASLGPSPTMHTCGVRDSGGIYCWGYITEDGSPPSAGFDTGSPTPVRLVEPKRIPNTAR